MDKDAGYLIRELAEFGNPFRRARVEESVRSMGDEDEARCAYKV